MVDHNSYKLSEKEHARILDIICYDAFYGKSPVNNPIVIFIAGQPGSGKSTLTKLHSKQEYNYIKIDKDDYRNYHPQRKEIFEKYDKHFSIYTDPDVIKWKNEVFELARKQKYNIILETTMRRPKRLLTIINDLKKDGYQIIVRIKAVNEIESKASIYLRYYDAKDKYIEKGPIVIPRFVSIKAHNEAYEMMPETLKEISSPLNVNCDRLEIYSRDNELRLKTPIESDLRLDRAFIEIRDENWDLTKYINLRKLLEFLLNKMKHYNEEQEHFDTITDLIKKSKFYIR